MLPEAQGPHQAVARSPYERESLIHSNLLCKEFLYKEKAAHDTRGHSLIRIPDFPPRARYVSYKMPLGQGPAGLSTFSMFGRALRRQPRVRSVDLCGLLQVRQTLSACRSRYFVQNPSGDCASSLDRPKVAVLFRARRLIQDSAMIINLTAAGHAIAWCFRSCALSLHPASAWPLD